MVNLQRRKQGALPRKIPSGRHIAGERENTMEENKLPLNEQEEQEVDLLTLTDENGEEFTCEIIAELECNGAKYLALVPYDEEEVSDETASELYILRSDEDEEGEYFSAVEDEEEYLQVSEKLRQLLSEEYNIQL